MTLEEAIASYEKSAERYHKSFLHCKAHGGKFYQEEAESNKICYEHDRQLATYLRELQEIRKDRDYWQERAYSYEQTINKLTDSISKQPEIVRCGECTHYIPILSNWGKCGVHSSPTEKYRTCQICDYCSWAEKREEKSKWAKNPYSAGSC